MITILLQKSLILQLQLKLRRNTETDCAKKTNLLFPFRVTFLR